MIKEFASRIKVSSKVRPIPKSIRVTPELKIGPRYYVSFGDNYAYPCQILEIINEFDQTEVKIKIPLNPRYSSYRKRGVLVDDPFQESILYAYEIGITPEQAVENMV